MTFLNEAWKHVIFTDESKICVFGPDGNNRVWRRPGIALLDHHITPTVKFGGKSVMVWGAITYQGVGRLEFIDTRMTASSYIAILESQYALTVRMAGLNNETAILQQDNDPKHLAKETKIWLNANNIRLLSWPSCSPDMNIIENVWFYLKVRISSLREKPKNIIELKPKDQ